MNFIYGDLSVGESSIVFLEHLTRFFFWRFLFYASSLKMESLMTHLLFYDIVSVQCHIVCQNNGNGSEECLCQREGVKTPVIQN